MESFKITLAPLSLKPTRSFRVRGQALEALVWQLAPELLWTHDSREEHGVCVPAPSVCL